MTGPRGQESRGLGVRGRKEGSILWWPDSLRALFRQNDLLLLLNTHLEAVYV